MNDYFDPIYIIEVENGGLFSFRICHYHITKDEAIRIFNSKGGLRLIEKSMLTGNEKIIKEREIIGHGTNLYNEIDI